MNIINFRVKKIGKREVQFLEHLTAKERLVGFLKDKWIEKKAKEEKKFEVKGMELKVDLLDDDL